MTLSVLIPAHNEAPVIGATLKALAASDETGDAVEVIVVANGCTDDTVGAARACADLFAARGWVLKVLDLREGSKPGAWRAAEVQARARVLAYLDADIRVTPPLLAQAHTALDRDRPRWASGRSIIDPGKSFATRTFHRFYERVPFRAESIPGGGFFALNRAGRARWDSFPDVVADDLFVRLHFAPHERLLLDAAFHWRLAEGLPALVRARRRQDRGTRELMRSHPELFAQEDKRALGKGEVMRMAAHDPLGFAVYGGVRALARMPAGQLRWSEGR